MSFKRNTKGIGLTYSNIEQQFKNHLNGELTCSRGEDCTCGEFVPDKAWLAQELLQLPGNDPHHIIVAEEKHQDGARHFHVYIQWLAPAADVRADYFDIRGMHPNIQQIKNQSDWVNYIQKEDVQPFVWVPILFLDDSDDEGYDSPSQIQ